MTQYLVCIDFSLIVIVNSDAKLYVWIYIQIVVVLSTKAITVRLVCNAMQCRTFCLQPVAWCRVARANTDAKPIEMFSVIPRAAPTPAQRRGRPAIANANSTTDLFTVRAQAQAQTRLLRSLFCLYLHTHTTEYPCLDLSETSFIDLIESSCLVALATIWRW